MQTFIIFYRHAFAMPPLCLRYASVVPSLCLRCAFAMPLLLLLFYSHVIPL